MGNAKAERKCGEFFSTSSSCKQFTEKLDSITRIQLFYLHHHRSQTFFSNIKCKKSLSKKLAYKTLTKQVKNPDFSRFESEKQNIHVSNILHFYIMQKIVIEWVYIIKGVKINRLDTKKFLCLKIYVPLATTNC